MSAASGSIRETLTAHPRWVKSALLIFFSVGIAGFSLPLTRELFTGLTPLAIILSLSVLLIFHEASFDRKTVFYFISIIVITWLIEAAGVATGLIFGEYSYGSGLGIRLLDTPLLIGFNWLFMIYTSSCIAGQISSKRVIQILSASSLMVLYDFIMENIAGSLDMWSFSGGMPPLRNYIAWFIIAASIHTGLKSAGIKFTNRIAPFLFFVQAVFFIILIIIIRLYR